MRQNQKPTKPVLAYKKASQLKRFTLIELLVVVAIIGILASLLLPSLSKSRDKARQAVCLSQLKQLNYALYNYIDDNDGKYPLTFKSTNSNIVSWDDLISGYDGRAPLTSTEMKLNLNSNTDNALYVCPGDTIERNNASWPKKSYAMTTYIPGHATALGITAYKASNGVLNFDDFVARKVNEISNPSQTILLTEFFWSANRMGAHYGNYVGNQQVGYYYTPNPALPIAHKNKYNYSMVDGSAQAMVPTQTLLGLSPTTTIGTMWDAGR
ncbi:hypothetical protein LNTAR_23069 [Lentisphaera araneosa HTCC2155]|jgi:prepilin-type N-terminal cleavage/methylation domain-containing protein/prepilin-type processing-associated H-X9-DG protein|uniref:Uncharacterized protein n=1 Tax=Lentisphaera araneosa HTCC2155 TaxID=313628 RepID=A6DGK5_9BACT|nr:prepilin-type N-terminal cleavage/methylation domain-containing protein [Lentisphaera araneosa]EDM29322.1 hypothetical protein LNTAR_23069 [Lentisphaera araneosa HTCC2155]